MTSSLLHWPSGDSPAPRGIDKGRLMRCSWSGLEGPGELYPPARSWAPSPLRSPPSWGLVASARGLSDRAVGCLSWQLRLQVQAAQATGRGAGLWHSTDCHPIPLPERSQAGGDREPPSVGRTADTWWPSSACHVCHVCMRFAGGLRAARCFSPSLFPSPSRRGGRVLVGGAVV